MRISIFCVLSLCMIIIFNSCQEEDLLSPTITLEDEDDTLMLVLNAEYDEPGFSATDNVDGTITDRVYVNNNVNEDLVGFYEVEYSVVDEAGNEADRKVRVVEVYNQARALQGEYSAINYILYPEIEELQYQTQIFADTTINNCLYFSMFADTMSLPVYFTKTDTVLEIPYQSYEVDNITVCSFSGNGTLEDYHIEFDYIKNENDITYLSRMLCDMEDDEKQ